MTGYNNAYDRTYPFSDTGAMMLLAASTEIRWIVPGDSSVTYKAVFSTPPATSVWVRLGGTAAVPTTNTVTDLVNQERIGDQYSRYVRGGDILSFISIDTPEVGVVLYKLP
jgi:hypothetical protein